MRNNTGLTPNQITNAQNIWEFLTQESNRTMNVKFDISNIKFDTSNAHINMSKTVFNETSLTIKLGADAYPTIDSSNPNSRMSVLACLCHEFSHAQRYLLGFRRPLEKPNSHLDESETSIHASFIPVLGQKDRIDLIEDAELRIINWKGEI